MEQLIIDGGPVVLKKPTVCVILPAVDGGGGRNIRTGQLAVVAVEYGPEATVKSLYCERIDNQIDSVEVLHRAADWLEHKLGQYGGSFVYCTFARGLHEMMAFDASCQLRASVYEQYCNAVMADATLEAIAKDTVLFPSKGGR